MARSSFNPKEALRVYLIADPEQTPRDLVSVVDAALRGGVTLVQLRAKSLSDRETIELGRTINALCRRASVPLIVNDRVDLALAVEADGVHLGVDDLPVEVARDFRPEPFVIGYSPETDEQAARAGDRGASYLGVGPVFGTSSKSDAGSAIGLDLLRRRAAIGGLPTIGIGGITPENAGSVIAAGACGVAVIGAILRSADPEAAARSLREAVDTALEHGHA